MKVAAAFFLGVGIMAFVMEQAYAASGDAPEKVRQQVEDSATEVTQACGIDEFKATIKKTGRAALSKVDDDKLLGPCEDILMGLAQKCRKDTPFREKFAKGPVKQIECQFTSKDNSVFWGQSLVYARYSDGAQDMKEKVLNFIAELIN